MPMSSLTSNDLQSPDLNPEEQLLRCGGSHHRCAADKTWKYRAKSL